MIRYKIAEKNENGFMVFDRPLKLQVHHWGTGREEGLVRGLEVERFSGAMI